MYIFNFIVEILLILTCDLRSVDQTINDSPFYIMWVVGFEMKTMISMSRFPFQFCGQMWTPLHDQNVEEGKITGIPANGQSPNPQKFRLDCRLQLRAAIAH